MDQDRQIRFLIPPFFLYASLLWAALVDQSTRCLLLGRLNSFKDFLPILTVAGVATVPLGFTVGTITISLLRTFTVRWKFFGGERQFYEAWLTKDCFEEALKRVRAPEDEKRRFLLQTAATFDHELLHSGVHLWLLRRWSSFNISLNSAVALLLAMGFAWGLHIRAGCGWVFTNLGLVSIFLVAGFISWHEAMEMIEFQALRRPKHEEKANPK